MPIDIMENSDNLKLCNLRSRVLLSRIYNKTLGILIGILNAPIVQQDLFAKLVRHVSGAGTAGAPVQELMSFGRSTTDKRRRRWWRAVAMSSAR